MTRHDDNECLRLAEAWIERERFRLRDECIAVAAFIAFGILLFVALHLSPIQ